MINLWPSFILSINVFEKILYICHKREKKDDPNFCFMLTLSKFPEFKAFLPVQGNLKKHCYFF